ncbi:MAG: dynamin family protein [Anaerolineae bacterium]|nr:dynamin family protein [Anaerolineae bacterium]
MESSATETSAPGAGPGSGAMLHGPIAEWREQAVRLLVEAGEHIARIPPDGPADRARLMDAANDLRDMFLLVTIIGEFNAGKSTFINALLGEPLLPMGITPTTDAIELIRYAPGPGKQVAVRDNAVREWTHPHTGGEGIAIVDTPGTGSVFQKHEQIAKSFLHRSDLVIFLLSAKRAFADTERLYLELARSYGKKIVVIVNQVDLLDPKEQSEVRRFVQQQLDQLLNLKPPIFMVAARRALQNTSPSRGSFAPPGSLQHDSPPSEANDFGMAAVRAYLRDVFAQVPPARQKLATRLDLLRSILARYRSVVQSRLDLIGHDRDAAEALQGEIEQQAKDLDRQLTAAVAEVVSVLEGVRARGMKFIDDNINVVRAALRGMDRDKLAADFTRTVLGDAPQRISSAQEHYVNALVDGSRAYWRNVLERLSKLDALLREESSGMDAADYADQRAALQQALTLANIELRSYTDNRLIQDIEAQFDENVRGFTYSAVSGTGGAIAVILSLAGAAAPGAIPPLAVLGLVVGVPAIAIGGGLAFRYWRKSVADAKKKLEAKVQEFGDTYRGALARLTTDERYRLVQYGQQILAPVFSQLGAVGKRYHEQQAALESLGARAEQIENALEKLDAGESGPAQATG